MFLEVQSFLEYAVKEQKLPHAILFWGQEAFLDASRCAAFLLCENPRKGFEPCEHCTSCLRRKAFSHEAYFLIDGEKDRPIRIDSIRAAQEFHVLSQERCRVVEIRAIDAVNSAAGNALLKLLEEPHPRTYLILSTKKLSAVPRL